MWTEFFPTDPVAVVCNNYNPSPGDYITADSYYDYGTGYYHIATWDESHNPPAGCSRDSNPANNGGAVFTLNGKPPKYGRRVAEQPNNNGAAGQPVPPMGSFWLNGHTVYHSDLTTAIFQRSKINYDPNHPQYGGISAFSTGDLWPPSTCSAGGFGGDSCFELTWTGK
jgi:hypothetical protein